jgi:hypothetical protein
LCARYCHQHLHLLLACRNRLFGSFAAFGNFFICPALLAQNDFLLAARLPVGFFSVTAVFSLDPGFCRLYLATPFAVMPAPALVGRLSPLFMDIPFMPLPLRTRPPLL